MTAATWTLEGGHGGRRVLAVHGDFDIAAEQAFMDDVRQLLADDVSPVELNLSGVGFMDSSGIRVLVVLRDQYGSRVAIGELSEPVRKLFVLAGVLDWMSDGADESAGTQSRGQQ